jgi:catechol 2,3-dioxygenase-like lactoylglutathione lyase family enzyme
MAEYERIVPVLQVTDVEASRRWYAEVLGFSGDTFPDAPPYTFAILRRDAAEIMLQCGEPRTSAGGADPEFLWSVYLRVAGETILDLAAAVAKKTPLLRGPERMFYGLVEIEVCDADGYRVCISGEAPAGANVKPHQE